MEVSIITTRLDEIFPSLRDDPRRQRRRNYGSQMGNSPSTRSSSSQDDVSLRRKRPLK